MDFGNNPTTAPAGSRKKKDEETYGIVTIELPNGQRLDGYVTLSDKNLGRLGLTVEQAKALGSTQKTLSAGSKLHFQFGDRQVKVAEAVAFDA